MRYHDLYVQEDADEHEHEHGEEYTISELAREIKDWMKSEGLHDASLHVLWSDFPLKRHIETSNKWARVFLKGQQLHLWELVQGRQKGSKIIHLGVASSKKEKKTK